jgi:hypothetical protein
LIALLLSKARMNGMDKLEYDQVFDILKNSTLQNLPEPIGGGGPTISFPLPGWPWTRKTCDGKGWTEYPNDFYGYGRVDARAALGV